MFHFPEPSPRLKFSVSNAEELHQNDKLLDSFPIHSIYFLIPSSNSYKEIYQEMLLSDDCTYFIVENITALSLIQSDFLGNFVKAGLLFAITHDARVEIENFVSVIPPGKLVLSLERSIAQSLALHKENTIKKKKKRIKNTFETIIIDLTCTELYPGKKHYEFISSELSKIDHLKFSLLLRWKPSGNVCPQSLKSYFTSQGLKCIPCMPKHKEFLKFSVPVPKLNFEMKDHDVLNDILEWVGMQICGLEYSTDDVELVVPEFFDTRGVLNKCSFEGFYTKNDILPILKEMSKLFEKDSSLPFVAVCIGGYQDSFVQANGFQHFSSDDKFICIIIFPSSNYFFLTLNCR